MKGKKLKVLILFVAICVAISVFLIFAFLGMLDTSTNVVKAVLISIGFVILLGCVAQIVSSLFKRS